MFSFYTELFTVCSEKLGVENSYIPNENIQASNDYRGFEPWKARLNGEGFWAAAGNLVKPWIQADLGYQTRVSGVITQGDGGIGTGVTEDWVTSLKVSTKMTPQDDEVFVTEDGTVKVSVITLKLTNVLNVSTFINFISGTYMTVLITTADLV